LGGGNKSDAGLDAAHDSSSDNRKQVLLGDTFRILTKSPLRINDSMVDLDIERTSAAVSISTMMGCIISLVFIVIIFTSY
jgi:hypothetical protein